MNLGFEKINVYYDEKQDKPGETEIVIEPLERGFGTTLGVSFRRIMLAAMPGSSAIGVKIPGVFHQYAAIPGSSQDATDLILNIKRIRFGSDDEGLHTVSFSANKSGVYYAKDLVLPQGVTVQNPDQELILLTGDQPVSFEVYVKQGRGYVDAKMHTEFEDRPDVFEIDGMFSPVEKVGYKVVNLRIGQNANYEKLILNVTTDGSITAKDAVVLAAKIAKSHYTMFEGMSSLAEKTEIYQEKQEEEDKILDLDIEDLELSVRSYNGLKREGFTSVRKIISLTEPQLYAIHQLGERSVKEIVAKIEEIGLELRKD